MRNIGQIKQINLREALSSKFKIKFDNHGFARCPFHDDHNPSFSVNKKNGTWLWHCFSCEKGGSYIDFVMGKENISEKEAIELIADWYGLEDITENYDYTDETGDLLYQCIRSEPKTFKYRRPAGDGRWIWNLNGVRMVPYRLSEILKADTIIIVEGEKDVETIRTKLKCVATTNPFGSGKWREEYSQYFNKKKVAIIPDNDPPGKDHANDVARSLLEATEDIRIVELPDLPEKEDITYWLLNGGSKEKLEKLIKNSPPITKESF
ncbi:CHC2 zinc finger domain-containing protein [Acidobacteriota bacterium]